MTTPVRGRILAAIAAVLAVAGCASDEQPSPDPTASTSTSSKASRPSSRPTATPTPTAAKAPPVGTQLASLATNGRVNVLAGEDGFTVVQSMLSGYGPTAVDQSTITTYDVAGRQLTTIIPSSGFTGECGAADVSPGDKRLIVTSKVVTQPAQGVVPAQYSLTFTAFDARTGTRAWTATPVAPQPEQLSCSAYDGHLQNFQATQDGAWGSFRLTSGSLQVATAIDLATGELQPKADVLGVLGKSLVTGSQRGDSSQPDLYVLSTPPGWEGAGSFSTGSNSDNLQLIPMNDPGDVTSGLFSGGGNSYSTGIGLSSDAGLMFVTHATSDPYGTVLQAYSLPGMAEAWRQTTIDNIELGLIGSGGGTLVVRREAPSGTSIEGLDARNGGALWSLPLVDNICGLTTSQMLVSANGQLAVIDLASGEQLSYSAPSGSSSASCPAVLPGGIATSSASGGLVVTQVLEP